MRYLLAAMMLMHSLGVSGPAHAQEELPCPDTVQLEPGANVVLCPPPLRVTAGQEYQLQVVILNGADQPGMFAVEILHYANPNQGVEHEEATSGDFSERCPEAACRIWRTTVNPGQQAIYTLRVIPREAYLYITQVRGTVSFPNDIMESRSLGAFSAVTRVCPTTMPVC